VSGLDLGLLLELNVATAVGRNVVLSDSARGRAGWTRWALPAAPASEVGLPTRPTSLSRDRLGSRSYGSLRTRLDTVAHWVYACSSLISPPIAW